MTLADERQLDAAWFDIAVLQDAVLLQKLHEWYLAGYLYHMD